MPEALHGRVEAIRAAHAALPRPAEAGHVMAIRRGAVGVVRGGSRVERGGSRVERGG